MKNKIFRSLISITLVVTMIITLAGCGDKTPEITPFPTETPAPTTAPTVAPEKTPAPDKTQKPSGGKDEQSTSFDFNIKGINGEFGTPIKDENGDDISNGYFQISWDTAKLADEHYKITFDFELDSDEESKEFQIVIPHASAPVFSDENTTTGGFAKSEDKYSATIAGMNVTIENGDLIICLENADKYELSCEATVKDQATDFGAWSSDETYEYEYNLQSSLEIAKQPITIEIAPAVLAEMTGELKVLKAGTYSGVVKDKYAVDKDANGNTTVYLPSKIAFGDYKLGIDYESSYVKEGKIGSYAVTIAEKYTLTKNSTVIGTFEDIDDLNEELENYEITNIKNTNIYVISDYDYTEIADVETSIAEIYFSSANGFFDTNSNIKVQLPLALKRYNALSQNQKAIFDTFAKIGGTCATSNVGAFQTYAGTNSLEIESTSNDQAIALREFLEFAEEKYADNLITTAFDEYAEDAKLPEYNKPFSVKNSDHMASYNKVDSYFNSLSSENQDLIEAINSDWYKSYQNAKNLILTAEIDSVEQLISGAFGAYLNSISSGNKVIYQLTDTNAETITKWAYIYSEEVEDLTKQAQSAYNALPEDAKETLKNASQDSLIRNYANYVEFKSADEMTCYNALNALTNMLEMVDVMNEIVEYVNIEDYSTNDLTYDRLNRLVYGVDEVIAPGSTIRGGLYFPTYTKNSTDYRFAMQDLMNAPSRNYDAIIEEYREWLLYVVAIEEYKQTVIVEFVSQISSAVKDLDKEDYSAEVLANADGGNAVYGMIMGAITSENPMQINGMYAPTIFKAEDILGGTSGNEIIPFFDKDGNFLEDKDNFQDIYEAYDNFLDIADIIDAYIDAIKEL